MMTATEVRQAQTAWPSLAPILFVPHSEREYEQLRDVLDALTDVVREDEDHPPASLMEVIGVLIERYEDEHVPELTDA